MKSNHTTYNLVLPSNLSVSSVIFPTPRTGTWAKQCSYTMEKKYSKSNAWQIKLLWECTPKLMHSLAIFTLAVLTPSEFTHQPLDWVRTENRGALNQSLRIRTENRGPLNQSLGLGLRIEGH